MEKIQWQEERRLNDGTSTTRFQIIAENRDGRWEFSEKEVAELQ